MSMRPSNRTAIIQAAHRVAERQGGADFSKDGASVGSSSGGLKVKDGYKIPMDYQKAKDAGTIYNGQNYTGDDNLRGVGVFASEDFAWDGTSSFSSENYAVAARWEYVSYSVSEGMWPSHGVFNGCVDGVNTSASYENTDSDQYSWTVKQKVLVTNPENGKAVVCIVGNGTDDPNWGGSPLETVAGLSFKAQNALGFTAGGITGTDYPTNSRDSAKVLQMSWAPDDAVLGPTVMGNIVASSKCKVTKVTGGGNASIADAAVSIAYETKPESVDNDGTDLYRKIHDLVIPGDSLYQSCDRVAATAVRWSGADDNFPPNYCPNIIDYLSSSPKWTEINAKSEADLLPGDIMIDRPHVMVYVGNAAVIKKYPASDATVVDGSYGERSASCSSLWNTFAGSGGEYRVFRNIQPEVNSVYKNLS